MRFEATAVSASEAHRRSPNGPEPPADVDRDPTSRQKTLTA